MSTHLLHGHARFRDGYVKKTRSFLDKLASEGQNPDALFIGCADSRVIPELLTSSSPGRLFVVRNVANIVPTFANVDSSVGAALEYGVGVLGIDNIIVCGHTGCGGVHALLDPGHGLEAMPSVREWLENARAAVNAVRQPDVEAWGRAAVEANVLNSLANLSTYPAVAQAIEEDRVNLHGWVYDLRGAHLDVYDGRQQRFVPPDEVLARTYA
jgi:carbonic anhydrase